MARAVLAAAVLVLLVALGDASAPSYRVTHAAGGRSLNAAGDDTHTLLINVYYPPERLDGKSMMLLGTDLDWEVNDPDPPYRVLPHAIMAQHAGEPGHFYAKLLYPASLSGEWFNYTVLFKERLFDGPSETAVDDEALISPPLLGRNADAAAGAPPECINPLAQTPSIVRSHVLLDGDTSTDFYPFFCALSGELSSFSQHSPQFNDTRDIHVWIPPAMVENSSPRNAQVMFVNDGELVPKLLHPYLNALAISGLIADTIVVGVTVDPSQRQYQLTPTVCEDCADSPFCNFDCTCSKGGASGGAPLYFDFLIDTLLPVVLKRFNMQVRPGGVSIGGWSYGGLNACYAAYMRPQAFGAGYCGSPSVWWNCEQLRRSIFPSVSPIPTNVSLLLDVGSAEGAPMVPPTQRLYEELVGLGFTPEHNVWLDVVDGDYHTPNSFVSRFWTVGPRLLGSPFTKHALRVGGLQRSIGRL